MAAFQIVRISAEEDAFAADETKVHTLSRQAISEMLDTAERSATKSSAPPPASGVRPTSPNDARASRPAPTQSGTMPKIPTPDALPVIWDDADEDHEPTRLCERASAPRQELPHQGLVAELINKPPVIICRPTPMPAPPATQEHAPVEVPAGVEPMDRRALVAITLATFLVTLVPGLVVLHHLLSH